MCKCGCNTCESIRGPLLTEGRVKKLISENLSYHIDNNISLMENVFRIGSDAHLSMIKEAKKLYSRGVLDLCEEDEALMETHLGEFDLYENEIVPLDLPMLEEQMDLENEYYVTRNLGRGQGKGLVKSVESDFTEPRIFSKDEAEEYIQKAQSGGAIPGQMVAYWVSDKDMNKINESLEEAYSGFIRNPEDPDSKEFEPTSQRIKGKVDQFKEDLRTLFGKFKGDLNNPDFIRGVAQIMVNWKPLLRSQLDEAIVDYDFSKEELIRVIKQLKRGASTEIGMIKAFEKALGRELTGDEIRGFKLDEAKKKKKKEKKDPPIGKPKRGGSKAYYVYVRDPKTKKVKKVSFGSGGLRAKIKNKKARNAFAARHNCKNKKDRTKAGYWSCNLPRYASQLGLGANMNTFW